MKHLSACTSVLVGKDASIDGSTMIARNDDTFLPLTPQRFYVEPAYQNENKVWKSNQNGFTMTMPTSGYRYLLTPNADIAKEGVYAESGFNQKNVAMSATESVYGNLHTLAYDPWVTNGLAEDSLQSMVLPYINSAREGVSYLGSLIKKYGSPEGNGVLFSDNNEVWYMEIVTGHHWVAQRIPDDSYAVVANQVAIQQVDFDDPDNFMFSDGIQEFVAKHRLNPDAEGFNFRHIFGTSNEKDRHYNTPRVWYGQRYLNPEIEQSPTSSNLPFIRKANRKIAVTDVEFILSSHYNETEYDPLGNGPEDLKTKFRPISMNRTQNSHVLQIRNDVDSAWSAIMWLNFGIPAFSPYVPFFANVNATDPTYENTPLQMDDTSAYWMYRKLSMLTESHYSHFIQMDRDFKTDVNQMFLTHIDNTIDQVKHRNPKNISAFLQKQNQSLVAEMRTRVDNLMHELMSKGLTLSKLTYDMDKNL
ncbi:peptidase C69 [Fructilactobacillus lindneri]|uniref:Dipeptidase n=2 Tax=Fructilactobacillus lindneri TaxID=53444 RepID=A0A0R2JMY2_9LACO|nr:C69 family dipeptidase [Fructilactobacillus lindneri]ANZ57979.1 peptidase C69 [Fructilactobacillus lindneri]ANZ59249.1 peptidase C69 [Fructilactobacillus lindneri]KRN78543.1 dipeptidase [Fructilactobacillus lindneri DSM 20690 = JCM 11027]POG98301.1 peptidase C69 [Fructilactobacillus lindneri]POH01582.1 peptidase C69 [Fructilactobacillus lindneri]